MWQPPVDALAAAFAHAGRCAPAEACGVIAAGGFVPIANRATDYDRFVMDWREYAAVAGAHKIEAIAHSHVEQPPLPSETDHAFCEKLGLPWLILAWPSRRFTVIEPQGATAPLIGRPWVWGTQDCFGLVRDAFRAYTGILIPDFCRDWAFWQNGEDLIGAHCAEAGFLALPPATPPRHCDVLAMQVNASPVANHLALFLAPDLILHHLIGRLSRRQPYDGFFQRKTVRHFRHERLA